MNKKLSQLPIKNTPDYSEYLHILDVNDLSGSPQGSDKRVLLPNPKATPIQIRVTASTTILPSWNNAIIIITAPGVVLTVPADLPVITFKLLTRPTATCDFVITAPKVWVNGAPTLVTENSIAMFLVDSLNSNEIYVKIGGAVSTSDLFDNAYKTHVYVNDFLRISDDGTIRFIDYLGGTFESISGNGLPNNTVGVVEISTNSSNTSQVGIVTQGSGAGGWNAGTLGNGKVFFETYLKVPVLSNATDRFVLIFGNDYWTGSRNRDGNYFIYDEGGLDLPVSANWRAVSASGGLKTITNTGIAVNTDFNKFRIEINANNTEVKFYINNVLVSTNTTNLPDAYGFFIQLYKITGTTPRKCMIDYMAFKYELLNSR